MARYRALAYPPPTPDDYKMAADKLDDLDKNAVVVVELQNRTRCHRVECQQYLKYGATVVLVHGYVYTAPRARSSW